MAKKPGTLLTRVPKFSKAAADRLAPLWLTTAEELMRSARAVGCEGIELAYPYDYGAQGLPSAQVRTGVQRLKAGLRVSFPSGGRVTRGSDMHDLAEWPARLACVAGWERDADSAGR